MADRPISALAPVTQIQDADMFVLQQGDYARQLTGLLLKTWLNSKCGIKNIAKTSTSGIVDTYTVTTEDNNTYTFTVTNGDGIKSISSPSSSGLVDTYTITLDSNRTYTFTVTNGKSISSVTYKSSTPASGTNVGYDTYQINYNDNTSSTFNAYYGKDIYLNGNPPVKYALTSSGTSQPATTSSDWKDSISALGSVKGKYLWIWDRLTYNTGQNEDRFSVTYNGADGTGSVNSVNSKTGAVVLYGSDIATSSSDTTKLNTALEKREVYVLTTGNFSALPFTYPTSGTDSNIESDMVVVKSYLSTPSAQGSNWTVSTASGSLTITGTYNGTTETNITLYLEKSR